MTKLHQNRGVILGVTQHDAASYAHNAAEDEVVFVGSSSPALTIRGGVGGMHVRTLYVTPHARQGLNYEVALEALEPCLERAQGTVVHLDSRG